MSETRVIFSRAIRATGQNTEKLEKKAAAVAENITVPPNITFAKFEHRGRTYALSARAIVEVDTLDSRVPDIVIWAGRRVRSSWPEIRREKGGLGTGSLLFVA